MEDNEKNYAYVLRSNCGKLWKYGITKSNYRRFRKLSRSTPFEYELVAFYGGTRKTVLEIERTMHSLPYEHPFIDGDDHFDGFTEWLKCDNNESFERFKILCSWHGAKRED